MTFTTDQQNPFSQLIPGDKIFIYNVAKRTGPLPWLPDQSLTIAHFATDNNRVFFESRPTLQEYEGKGPPASMDCFYRAAWIPAGVRITLRIKDSKGDAIRTIRRVIRIHGG